MAGLVGVVAQPFPVEIEPKSWLVTDLDVPGGHVEGVIDDDLRVQGSLKPSNDSR